MTNKHPDALPDGTFSKSTIKRLDLCTSGEPVKESAESVQMDALVEVAIDAMYGVTIDEAIDKQVNGMRAALLAIDLPKLLADVVHYQSVIHTQKLAWDKAEAELAALLAVIDAAQTWQVEHKDDYVCVLSHDGTGDQRVLLLPASVHETTTPESSVSGPDLAGKERFTDGGRDG